MQGSIHRWQILFIVGLMIGVAFSSVPSAGTDQLNSRVSTISAPSDAFFHSIRWNEENYDYAIAVGEYINDENKGMIFRYNPETGWTNLSSLIWDDTKIPQSFGEVMHDVVYYKGDSFFLLGDNGGECIAYIAENASGNMSLVYMNNSESAGSGFSAGCYDPNFGTEGALVGVGTPYEGSGMISWFDLATKKWNKIYAESGVNLNDVTCDRNASTPYVIAVGYDKNTDKAVAYLCDYKEIYPIKVPDDAEKFYSVDWAPDGDYLLISGTNYTGAGKVWKMNAIKETIHISYYDSTSGKERLKYAFFNGYNWNISVVDSSEYAGYYTSIATDWNGEPHISYWDGGSTHLKHAYMQTNGEWYVETVDSSGNVGQYSSIAVDVDNDVRISYYDATNKNLKYAIYDSGTWNIETIQSGSSDVGQWTSMALIPYPSNPYAAISYYDSTNNTLMYTYQTSFGWNRMEIGAPNAAGGGPTCLKIGPDYSAHISYYDSQSEYTRYAYASDTQSPTWNTGDFFSADGPYNSLDLNSILAPGVVFTNNGRNYLAEKTAGRWSPAEQIDYSNAALSFKYGIYDEKLVAYTSTGKGLRLAVKFPGEQTWSAFDIDPDQNTGTYNSMALGVRANFTELKGTEGADALMALDWEDSGELAMAVGENGDIFVYYPGQDTMSNWTSSVFKGTLSAVAVKSPASPAYGLALGESSTAPVISYQTYNTGTTVNGQSATPHINEMELLDSGGNDRLNRQSDVGSTYTFFINASYDLGWSKVGGIDIYAWYDFGDDSRPYNDTQGKNCNFHLHFTPDTTDPVNNEGIWRLLWPNGTDEVKLIDWYQKTEDRAASGGVGGTPGSDEYDYFLLYVNISFGEQLVYAPGNGWTPSSNQSDPAQSFNDINSWNFNITIYDKNSPLVKETKYDEFGIYAYTEVSVQNNPAGVGFPGSTIDLNPPTKIGIRANLPYRVTVNISDLRGQKNSSHIIGRGNVEVINAHPDANSTNSDISDWAPFTNGNDPLYVWGTDTYYMPDLCNGTWSAGLQGGYSSDDTYTYVYWRINIPPNTLDDEYSSVVAIEITY